MRTIVPLLTLLCSLSVYAQLPDETNGRVPELDAFHTPIYTLWHEAWPAKDVKALKELFPRVDKAFSSLSAAVLPGILRDKQTRWNEKLDRLRTAVEEYRTQIAGNDTAAILRAAEDVHMVYEQMVRIVRPVSNELDAFHRILYSLHHYGIPEKNMAIVRSSEAELAAAMAVLDTAALPKRWEKKQEQYEKSRTALSTAVQQYTGAVRSAKPFDIIAALERSVHSKYQMLEKVFE